MNLIAVAHLFGFVSMVTTASYQKLHSLTADQNGFNISVGNTGIIHISIFLFSRLSNF